MNDYGLRIEYVEYSVKKGDSLYAIAKMFNTTVSDLIDINMLTSNTLFPGQVLLVPKKTATESGFDFYIYKNHNYLRGFDWNAENYGKTADWRA